MLRLSYIGLWEGVMEVFKGCGDEGVLVCYVTVQEK